MENIDNKNPDIIKPKLSWKEKINQWIGMVKNQFHDVILELTQKIEWTKTEELWDFIKQFTLVTSISIICLFIIDNIIIFLLKKIF
jgi:preprotein translocase subunit SecE